MARPEEASRPRPDGRLLRSERSREAIVRALLDLVGEGVLAPTAQQVAERAGVGIRTVFRHFRDMDTLFAEMDARLRSEVRSLVAQPPIEGAVDARAAELLRRRSLLFERIAPYKRAGNVQRWRSPFLEEQHRAFVRRLRKELLRWLPELDGAPPDRVAALELATSFEAWDRLRSDQRLSAKRALEAMRFTALRLLGDNPPS